MHLSSVLSLVLTAASTVLAANNNTNPARCGTTKVSAKLREKVNAFAAEARQSNFANKFAGRTQGVNVYFHVIQYAPGNTEASGYVSQQTLNAQLNVLNSYYAQAGIYFNYMGADYTVSPQWATYDVINDDATDINMKSQLRRGNYQDLNVYFRPLAGTLLGICTFPTNAFPGSHDFYKDGCIVHSSAVPGGALGQYSQGKTAVHEVGHWFGLFHTFQDGCYGGDGVSDTPAEDSPAFGCPVGRDSCYGAQFPGYDPIDNFMDYSDDYCRSRFTPGQIVRMYQFFDGYRSGH